ncbi:MAG: hypothetical protein AAF478_03915 [Pseudomonadota bacterium]
MKVLRKSLAGLLSVLLLSPFNPIQANAENSEKLILELNKIEASENSCLLTFLVTSSLSKDLEKLAYEFVVFDNDMKVNRMTVFDFQDLNASKIRVRQFQLADTPCETLGRLLINDTSACKSGGVDSKMCSDKLEISNKTQLEFLN